MRVENVTPFPHLLFQTTNPSGREFWVLVMRGTFRIAGGGPLEPAEEQHPIVKTDVFRGPPNASSVLMESDIVSFKPRSDILVNAVAHAPQGRAVPSWFVRVQVGEIEKSLRVTGPRQWRRKRGSFRLDDPEDCTEVPVIYENAFGGCYDASDGRAFFRRNLVGVGFVPTGVIPDVDSFPAPRIENPEHPIEKLGEEYSPEGLGPMTRSWQPRLGYAGTFDDAWRETRWPLLPEEFDYAHYNSAHPDLTYPRFLRGNEDVVLENLSPRCDLRFRLPGLSAIAVAMVRRGAPTPAPAWLDTLFLDVPAGLAHITWRASFPADMPIRQIWAGTGPIKETIDG